MAEISASHEAEIRCQFLTVPANAIIQICLCLPASGAIKLALACRGLYKLITSSHKLWRAYCCRVWLYSGPCPPDISWYSEFVRWCGEWGPYQDVYAHIKKAWDLVYLQLQQAGHNPDLIFCPGASEVVLKASEERLRVALPRDYKCFLRIHDGQRKSPGGLPDSFFGTRLHFYQTEDEGSLLMSADNLKIGLKSVIPICMEGRLQSYVICVKPDDQSKLGSVQCISKISRFTDSIDWHILASSFKEWFCRFACEMQTFPIVNNVIQRFPYHPDCVATTRGITIRVGTAFSNIHSRAISRFLVIYHITISMSESESASLTSQLTTRHWFIKDDQGKQDEVHGEGVVGFTPKISPGTVFTYTSGSYVEREWSIMEGYFTFRNLSTGDTFDAKVPQFRLEVPPHHVTSLFSEH